MSNGGVVPKVVAKYHQQDKSEQVLFQNNLPYPYLPVTPDLLYCTPTCLSSPVFGMIITLGQAVVYVMSGMYGPPSDIGHRTSSVIIVLQVNPECCCNLKYQFFLSL